MNKTVKQSVIVMASCAILVTMIYFKPLLRQASAVKFIKSVLHLWEKGDSASAINHFDRPHQSPPITKIISYEIIDKSFKKKKGVYKAYFTVNLQMGTRSTLPDDRDWLFEIQKIPGGWTIMDFKLKK